MTAPIMAAAASRVAEDFKHASDPAETAIGATMAARLSRN